MVARRLGTPGAACVLAAILTAAAFAQTPASVGSALFDARALLADLRALSADDMQGRQIGTPGSAKARAFIVQRFEAAGAAPFGSTYVQSFPVARRGRGSLATTGANVVGHVAGSRATGRYIVVSAHYDHVGTRAGQVFNGADDNASGTAALAAIAAHFHAHPATNPLILAAFDGEEAGLLGSRAFVRNPPVDPASIAVNLNLDMIGRDPDNILYAVGPTRQPFLKPLVEGVARTAPVTLLIGHDGPGTRGDDWTRDSDQFAFLEAGIPALYFGVTDEGNHHRTTDDYETMTPAFYVHAVETSIQMIRALDTHLDAIAAERRSPRQPFQ